ncbi:hypothetical protein F4823DRAFT_557660 [Ustulina deusta]|nr:hypothetical protein F4823DRAFT_557660 [Ustulina deusta]
MSGEDEKTPIFQLFNNTENFLNVSPVNTLYLVPQDVVTSGLFRIMPFTLEEIKKDGSSTSPKSFYLKAVPDSQRGPSFPDAYFLSFRGRSQYNKPGFVDIPTMPSHRSMLFTGMLTGCSVIVTSLSDDVYRVYHDFRVNSSDLYDNVVASIDLRDYHDTKGGFATVCMSNTGEGDGWKLHAQLLDHSDKDGRLHFRHNDQNESRVVTRLMEPRQPGTVEGAQERRNLIWEKMERLAENPSDSKRDDAAAALKHKDGAFDENAQINLRRTAWKFERDEKLDEIHEEIQDLTEECNDNDLVYLWLKLKVAKQFDAVVSTEGRLSAGLEGDTVGERFAALEVRMESAASVAFAKGHASYTEVNVPGIYDTITSLEMKAILMVSLGSLEDKQLGALLRRIQVTAENETRTRVWKRADAVVKYLLDENSTKVQPMPQDVMATFQGRDSSGHCYPLIMAKLVSLRNKSESNSLNVKLMLDGLEESQGNLNATAASTLRGRVTIEQGVDALVVEGGAKSKVLAINTREHAMLLGVTVRDSKTAYHFYDPNFAMATFASKETLLKALNRHLATEGFASTYSAFGTAEAPTFNLVEIDAWEMSRVSIGSQLTLRDLSSDDTLVETASAKWRRSPIQASHDLVDRPSFQGTHALSEALQATKSWREAVARLEKANGLEGSWIPILKNLEPETGGGYRVQFINIEDPSQT